ncbi:UNVERIFIED_CONTAM: peptide/nickel transport system permease protein [Williamsia faeni]
MRGQVRRWIVPVGSFLILIALVTIAVFLLLELIPGDPVDGLVPSGASEEMRQHARVLYGLDQPLYERYLTWVGGIMHGDFGRSYTTGMPVLTAVGERTPVSLELAALAMVVALVISIPVAVWSAYRPQGVIDRIATALTSATLAVPSFVLGILLVYVFAVKMHVLPVLGWVAFAEDPVQHFQYLILPVLTLAAGECVLFTRLLKGDMLATLQQDHVMSARARGLPTRRILIRHSLKQSSFSLVTVSGVVIGRLIGGTVIVESIFAIPGLGTLVVTSIQSRDFIVVQAIVLLSALLYLVLNGLVDVTYPWLDPRVRKVRTS